MRFRNFVLGSVCVLLAITATGNARALQKAAIKQQLASSDVVGFDVYLPQQHRDQVAALLEDLHNSNSPNYQKWLTPQQFQARFGIGSADIANIQKELGGYGLSANATSPHVLHVTGTAAHIQQALGTELHNGTMPNGRNVVVATKALNLPGTMRSVGAVVTGFSGTVRMHSYAKRAATPSNRYSSSGLYWFDDLKQAYSWPSYQTYTGKGATVALLMSGGYSKTDMASYFGHEKLAVPKISEVDVLGGNPFNVNDDGSFEAELDIQQAGGMAPGANIVLYSIPDLSDDSIIAGLSQIIADNKADVVSMSFGGPELFYTPEYNGGDDYTSILLAEDDLMAQGNAQGITFIASSGDEGALSAPPIKCFDPNVTSCGYFRASAEFPASSPHVTGVGGTNLKTVSQSTATTTNLNSAYVSEQAYADPLTEDIFYGTPSKGGYYWGSGGGDSIVFRKPLFQRLVDTGNASARTVPDLALHMGGCPAVGITNCNPDDSGDVEAFGGQFAGVIGTSASAPDFAGLTALNVERYHSRMGNENYYIYALATLQHTGLYKVFHTRIPGFNGLYYSGNDGYNRVLGNGTLYGKDFILAPLVPSAGVPQSPSNP